MNQLLYIDLFCGAGGTSTGVNTARLHRGYTSTTMLFEIKSMHIGFGNPAWGAPEEEVFIIKFGERIVNPSLLNGK